MEYEVDIIGWKLSGPIGIALREKLFSPSDEQPLTFGRSTKSGIRKQPCFNIVGRFDTYFYDLAMLGPSPWFLSWRTRDQNEKNK